MQPIKELEEIAISRIIEFEPKDLYWMSFSGGKDSIVAYDLLKKSGVEYEIHFNQTTIDPPEIYKFVRLNYPEAIWEKPKRSMFQAIEARQIPPTGRKRYCCAELKELHGIGRTLITGVRREESASRSERPIFGPSRHNEKTLYCNPIVDWKLEDVWNYIKESKLKYPCLYDQGYTRVGCIMCPLQGRYGMCKDALRYPRYYKRYLSAFNVMLNNCHERKPKEKLNDLMWKSAEDVMFWWIYHVHRVNSTKPTWKLPFEDGFDLESIKPRAYHRKGV